MDTKQQLLYQLKDKPPLAHNLLYGLQWAIFMYSLNLLYPLVIGDLFNMSVAETAALVQRSTFLIGLCSLLQVVWGHGLPLIEGVSALWFSIFILFAETASTLGQSAFSLLKHLEFGLIMVGIIMILLSVVGLLNWMQKLFTPLVTGCTLILLTMQISGSIVKGMLGFENGTINGAVALFSIGITALVTYLSYRGNRIFKSFSVLLGMFLGWILYNLLGLPNQAVGQEVFSGKVLYFPELFAWGTPQFSSGMVVTALVSALVLISNQVASITAVQEVLDIDMPPEAGKKSGIINGISNILAGSFAGIGTIPLANSAGFIKLTGIGAKMPFLIAGIMLMLIGFIWPLGQFFTLMPPAVAYAVSFATISQMLSIGVVNLTRVSMNQRNLLIMGLTLLSGVGVMFVPPTAYAGLPVVFQTVLSNGLLIGIMIVLLLEHLVFRSEK